MEVKPGYKQTEVGVIPEDWEAVPLGNLAEISAGGTPSRSISAYWEGDIPWVTTAEVNFGRITSTEQHISPLGLKNSAAKLLRSGTILMALYGQGKTRGKVAVLDIEATSNQACAAIVLNSKVSHGFVFNYLASRYDFIRGLSNTGNQENLNGLIVKSIPIPLPPTLAEQEAIAGALSDADALIESLEHLVAKKRQIKHGAMQELLTGQKRLPGFTGEWETRRFGEIGDFYSGGTPNTAIAEYYGGDIPWITSSDCNTPRIQSVAGRITEVGVRSSATKWIKSGTVLMALYGATAGVVAISEINATINQAVLAIVLSGANSEFMFQKLRMMKEWIITTYTQGGQPNLSGAIVKSIELTLPSLPEQQAIASILSDMDAEIAALEAKLAKARQVKQGMMQELLTGRIRLV